MPKAKIFKKKLTMTACTVSPAGSVTELKSKKFEVMLNPSSYSHDRKICYSKQSAPGQIGSDSKFNAIMPDKIAFDLVLDGTGVAVSPIPGFGKESVKTQIDNLNEVVYDYNGSNHEPNHVKIVWGSLLFYGRLDSMSTSYTLFKLGGDPLRAKLKLAFQGFITKKEQSLKANKSSPDLTHQIEFRQGDTLPLLCYRVYEDCAYYLEIARLNGISDPSNIEPGTRLVFPPLR